MSETIKVLKEIWETDICGEYQEGWIPNERTLQAALYHHLRCRGKRPIVEVGKFLDGSLIPDLIVAKGNHVEVVMELKFVPNKGVVWEKDLKKLTDWAARGRVSDTLRFDPRTMNWRPHEIEGNEYWLDPKTCWVFAAIGTDDSRAFDPGVIGKRIPRDLVKRFAVLTGVVHKDRDSVLQTHPSWLIRFFFTLADECSVWRPAGSPNK